MDEPILTENLNRFVLFPIKYNEIWELYKKAQSSIWFAEEIDLSSDINDFLLKLNDNERYFISMILAFFASADGIVNENLASRFHNEISVPEIRAFYCYQLMIESVHNETYSMLIDTLIKDQKEKDKLFNAITEIPCVKQKNEWALKWISNSDSFATRLVAFAVVEGIFFSGAFCAIYWLKKRNLCHGLTFSNQLIARDESIHVLGATTIYSYLVNKLSQDRIYEIVKEAVNIEHNFVRDSLPVGLIGMNSTLMCEYIEFVADRLIYDLGYEKLYNTQNPFPWMLQISVDQKENFFERRVSSYQRASVMQKLKDDDVHTFNMNVEF